MSSEDGRMIEILDSNGSAQEKPEIPKRNTTSLELNPDEIEKAEIARNQLLNLTKKPSRKAPATSDNEIGLHKAIKPEIVVPIVTSTPIANKEPITEVIYDGKPTMANLSSAIISKEELEDEIRKKIAIKSESRKSYDIEIPQELLLSEVPPSSSSKEEQVQLDGQELIDILEGNGDAESETFEVIGDNGMFIVKTADQETSFEIVSPNNEIKKKMLERQIAMQQIASMPVRKHRRLPTVGKSSTSARPATSLAQSLAMDWSDKEEEVILEVENVEETANEPKIKILNMTILNESTAEPKSVKNEPKILNINAPPSSPPKILNKMAPQTKIEPASFKRGRVVKKKQIWDPSESPQALPTEKKIEKLPIALPSTITIKKVTKESIAKEQQVIPKSTPSPARKGKKKSEIEKLFQDEGAVNMIYSLERQNNNQDVPELTVDANEAFVDKSEEKSTLIAKQKTIRDTIIKQSTSPNEAKVVSTRPQRVKRDLTPSKPVEPPKVIEKTPEKTVTVIKANKTTAGRKKKIDDSWDFVRNAQQTCADAMIIRRHSNSSYSSSAPTSPRRLSVDQSLNDSGENFKMPKERKSTEMPKDLKSSVGGLVEELRNTLNTKLAKGKTPPAPRGRKRAAATTHENVKRRTLASDKEYILTKADGVAQIVVSSEIFTLSLLESVKGVLTQLADDSSCKVVAITNSEGFSKGLDYSSLVQSTVDKRKQAASDLVTAVKNFLTSLAAFPKTLICGLKGLSTGIAVTMLPLFDIVISDQSAKFSLPHVQIGSAPEGISILSSSNKINSSVITQLFFLHETLDAKTALQSGLISKIVTGNIDVQLKEICKQISSQSLQALESTKKLINEEFLGIVESRLAKEAKILQSQWISAECQEKFKKFSASGEW